MDKQLDRDYLNVIDSWLNDSDICVTSKITDKGEHILAYYYYEESAFDQNITILTGQDWKEVLETGFINPIVDYLNGCKKGGYLEQTYFNAKELELLRPYINVDFKTKISENISSYRDEGKSYLDNLIKKGVEK